MTASFSPESKIISKVDDKPDITGLFRVAMQTTAGGRIYAFTEPTLALEHIKNNKSDYALVNSDFNVRNLNVIKIINNIQHVNPFIRTILMTAFEINDKLFQDLTKCEIINGFLQKPIKIEDLCLEVNKQLNIYDYMFCSVQRMTDYRIKGKIIQ